MAAPARMSHTELIFQRTRMANDTRATAQVSTSVRACCPSCTSTPVISAIAAALTPFSSVAVQVALRNREATG